MKFDPVLGLPGLVLPLNADEWRRQYGHLVWLYNPWTGRLRDLRDVDSDVTGLLIIPPGEPIYASRP